MNETLRKYLAKPVPRYTSYPTVPHFSPSVTGGTMKSWLGALDPAHPISLYLHVPFCRQLCWYCGCNMKLAVRDEPLVKYTDTLLRELDLVVSALPDRMTVDHLHWGGGTPTALRPDDLARVMEVIRHRFDLTDDAEFAIEADPRTLTADMARVWEIWGSTAPASAFRNSTKRCRSQSTGSSRPRWSRSALGGCAMLA